MCVAHVQWKHHETGHNPRGGEEIRRKKEGRNKRWIEESVWKGERERERGKGEDEEEERGEEKGEIDGEEGEEQMQTGRRRRRGWRGDRGGEEWWRGDEEETERWDAGETRRPIHRPQELPKSTLIHGILAGISSHTHNHTLTHAGWNAHTHTHTCIPHVRHCYSTLHFFSSKTFIKLHFCYNIAVVLLSNILWKSRWSYILVTLLSTHTHVFLCECAKRIRRYRCRCTSHLENV